MAEEQDKKKAPPVGETNGSDAQASERYRYIGFDVFPKRAKEFWKSDAERATHLAHVRETGARFVPLSRSNSLVASPVLSGFERIVLTLTSLLLVAAPFMPWFVFTREGERLSYSGFSMLANTGTVMSYLSMGAGLLTTSFILLLALMVVSMLFGIATLVFLYMGQGSGGEAYVGRIRRILLLQYLPIIGWVVFFSITAAPTVVPFAVSLGLEQVEHSLNIASLAASTSIGLWVPFAVLWVNAIKANDL
jgi:hypothetical protein